MLQKALLQEAQQLKAVCQRLELLTDGDHGLNEALLKISGSIRSTATILEVLVMTKLEAPQPQD
jgi:hypothetical protein